MVPGWRLGWLVVHTPTAAPEHIKTFNGRLKTALADLSTLILGPSCFHQSLVRPLLQDTPQSYHDSNLTQLRENAQVVNEKLGSERDSGGCPGLEVIKPRGAMYTMVRISEGVRMKKDGSPVDDLELAKSLLAQQSVFVLPGRCFGAEGCFRVVTSPPREMLEEACGRIQEWCDANLEVGA